MAPGLGLGPVPTGLVLVVELVLAGLTTTPPPKPRPHRLDPVHYDAPFYVLGRSHTRCRMAVTNPTAHLSPCCPRWRSLARALADDAGVASGLHPPAQLVTATARLRAPSSSPAIPRTCPTPQPAAVIHGHSRSACPLSCRIGLPGTGRGSFPSSRFATGVGRRVGDAATAVNPTQGGRMAAEFVLKGLDRQVALQLGRHQRPGDRHQRGV